MHRVSFKFSESTTIIDVLDLSHFSHFCGRPVTFAGDCTIIFRYLIAAYFSFNSRFKSFIPKGYVDKKKRPIVIPHDLANIGKVLWAQLGV
jgi:hypothetical protein